jgi:flagellar M-ring protein FliF
VTVIDANGTVLSAPGVSGGASGSNARTKEQTAYEQKVSAAIMAMLARTTGADKVAVTVTADLDLDERQSTSENYGAIGDDTSGGEVVSEKTNVEIYGPDAANGTTGILGPDGATITSTVPTSVSDGGYASADSDRAYAIDRVVEQVTDAPGEVNKLGVAVLLDEATVSEAQATQIEELVKTAAGIDPARGDIVTVTRLPFDTSAETEASEAAKQDAAAAAKTRMMELIRTLAVVFVIIIALVLAYRSTRKARKITATPIDIGEITASSGSGKSSGSLTPELVSSPGSGSVGAGDATPRAVGAGASHPNGLLLAMDKIDSPMAEIAEIAETRPEEVANVLRAWLNESKVGRR